MTAFAWTGPITAPRIDTRKRHGDRLTKEPTARSVFGSAPGVRRLTVPRLVRLGRWEGCPWPCERRFGFGFLKGFCQGTATLMTKLDLRFRC
jgi:hypothetical protein